MYTRKIKKVGIRVGTILLFSIFMFSCATTTRGLIRSNTGYEDVFRACVQAATEVDYGVTSSDIKTGFISAQQNIMGRSAAVVRMSIMVKQTQTGTEVEVSIVPPPGTIGNVKKDFDKFAESLKIRVPDVKVASVQ